MAAVLFGYELILYGPVPMIRRPLPGEPSALPIFFAKALDMIGANTRELAIVGSGCFSLTVTSLAPVCLNEATLAK